LKKGKCGRKKEKKKTLNETKCADRWKIDLVKDKRGSRVKEQNRGRIGTPETWVMFALGVFRFKNVRKSAGGEGVPAGTDGGGGGKSYFANLGPLVCLDIPHKKKRGLPFFQPQWGGQKGAHPPTKKPMAGEH